MDPAKVTTFVLAMLEQVTIPFKWALLDECLDKIEEDLEDNLGVLNSAALYSHVKIHLSDHRLLILEDAFDEYPNLELHRFTSSDIEAQVNDRLLDNAILHEIGGRRPLERLAFLGEIVHKASGAFIQVKVGVQSLLEGLRNFVWFSDLMRRLEHLLAEIEDLDDHILAKTLRNYHAQAFHFLQSVVWQKSHYERYNLCLLMRASMPRPKIP